MTCRNCGADGQDGRFCTRCGSAVVQAESPVRRSVRPVWWVVAALALVVACGFTAVVILRSGSAPSAGQPAAAAAADRTEDPTVTASPTESAEPASAAPSAEAQPAALPLNPTVIVLDASSSMEADDAPGPRIDAAKNAVRTLVDGLPEGAPVGLLAYRTSTGDSDAMRAAGCQDIKTLVPLGPVDRTSFGAAVDGVVASGYTPIAGSLRAAAAQLPAAGDRNIVVVSDGLDTCAPPDPCEVAKELAGPGLAIHTVGFRVTGDAKDQLRCIAQAGGVYVDAANAVQLQAFLRTAVDANVAVGTLTHEGFGGLAIGMSTADAKAVDPAIDPAASGTVVIVWRDCDLTFTDGTLVSVEPHQGASTQDGLTVGDDASKAGQLYGSSAIETDDGRTHAVFAVAPDGDLGYDVTFSPSADGQLAGQITRIVLCRCKPAQATSVSTVNPDDYLKTPGRWWFRTPDDGWNCSIAQQVFCETAHFEQNHGATYPQLIHADEMALDCGEIPAGGGVAALTPAAVRYGQCGHGEASEFGYDQDKGVPGLGRILPDGQVLAAGGFRCFVTGFAVTCGADPDIGTGFTVDQSDYRIYPRDGAIPTLSGASSITGVAVIGTGGFGLLRLGITLDEARNADPSLEVSSFGRCVLATTADVEQIYFNPDGSLSWILPRGNVSTPEGLKVGDTADKAFGLYLPNESAMVSPNYGLNYFPVVPGSQVTYLIGVSRRNRQHERRQLPGRRGHDHQHRAGRSPELRGIAEPARRGECPGADRLFGDRVEDVGKVGASR